MNGPDLIRLMRRHRVTIRELSRRTGITQKRIRLRRRQQEPFDYCLRCDWHQAVTGENIFDRDTYNALHPPLAFC